MAEDKIQKLIQERVRSLWQNTDFSATLFQNLIGYGVIAADFDGNILAYNEGARLIFGYEPQEVIGQQRFDIFYHAEYIDSSELQRTIDELLETGGVLYEIEKLRKNGEKFPAHVLLSLTKDADDEVVGFVAIVEDLTERKRIEAEIERYQKHLEEMVAEKTAYLEEEIIARTQAEAEAFKAKEHLEKVFNSVNDAIFVFDMDKMFVDLNPAAEKMFGYRREELLGQSARLIYPHGKAFENISQAIEKAIQERGSSQGELNLHRQDDRAFPAMYSAAHLTSPEGTPIGYVVAIQDITERIKAEKAIAKTADSLAEAQRIARLGSWEVSLKSGRASWTDEVYKIYGVKPEDLKKTYNAFFNFVHPDDIDQVKSSMTSVIKKGKPYRLSYRILRPDGSVRAVNTEGKFIKGRHNRAIKLIGTIQDVSEIKQAEKELIRLNRALLTASRCNQALVRSTEEKSLLDEVCHIMVETGGYRLVWVGYAESGAGRPIRPAAHAGFALGARELPCLSWGDDEWGENPASKSIRNGSLVVARNIAGDPSFFPWRETVAKYRLASAISLPLDDKGHTFGSLNIYSDQSEALDQPEIDLLKDLAGDLAYGVVSLRNQEARQQAERALDLYVKKLREIVDGVTLALAKTVESRDPYTAGHQLRVAELSGAIARELKLPQDRVDAIKVAGILHDVGKICVPAEILSKPTTPSDVEMSLVREHPRIGYEILREVKFPWPVDEIVHQHHERMDGSGYPRGLAGDEIMIEARILCAADVIEAISSDRPYRPALGIEKALEEVSRGRGTVYDSAVVDASLRIFSSGFKFKYASILGVE